MYIVFYVYKKCYSLKTKFNNCDIITFWIQGMDDEGAEILLSKYLGHFVKRSCQTIQLANHVASRSSKHCQIITKIINATGFGMFVFIFFYCILYIYIYIYSYINLCVYIFV